MEEDTAGWRDIEALEYLGVEEREKGHLLQRVYVCF